MNLLLGSIAMILQQTGVPDGVKVERDLTYGVEGKLSLKLDLWRPTGRPKEILPAVIFIHGGGWSRGDKWLPNEIAPLVRRGYAVASINYRLSGEAPFPAAVEDCKCAVRWMRSNARDYFVDPDRIGVLGGSAGGHLALMVACADESAGLEGSGGHNGVSSRVQAAGSWYGVTELQGGEPVRRFLGGTPREKPELYRQASPVTHVSGDDPPILLIHGEEDKVVPIAQSEVMLAQLEKAGVEGSLIRVKNAGHGFAPVGGGKTDPSRQKIHEATADFFDKHLRKK